MNNSNHRQYDRRPNYRRNNNNYNRRRRNHYRREENDQPLHDKFADLDLTVPADNPLIIGITGEPGSGKSALVREFSNLGAEVIDVDALGHEAIEGPATKKKLVERFGEEILDEDKAIIRSKLGDLAFADKESVEALNKIVHPRMLTKVKKAVKEAAHFVIIDAALLHELKLDAFCTFTVYVRASFEQRLNRVNRRGWDEAELQRRQDALGNPEERAEACDIVAENNGDLKLLNIYAKALIAQHLGITPKEEGKSEENSDSDSESEETTSEDNAPSGRLTAAIAQAPEPDPVSVELNTYLDQKLPELQTKGEELEIRDVRWLSKHELIVEILRRVAGNRNDSITVEGYIEIVKDTNAYLRSPKNAYATTPTDTFIPAQLLRRFGLKAGMKVVGKARAPRGNERCPQLLGIELIMSEEVDKRSNYSSFSDLVPLHAEERFFMERHDKPTDYNLRIIDLVAPIGKGQRGLIVAQPKCGKTVYLQKIANAISTNNPEAKLMILLIDERPEEVTDMQRHVKGEVIASTFDQHSSRHVQIAEMTINKAKRLVERGEDVVILLDSITRLARAYNSEAPSSGRIMSGGLEAGSLIKPKQFFGAARNIENGGSLTILATALVDTGSVMDTVIFEEFKGTGNMELVLDRRLANKGIYPALDIAQSSTRRDELLINNDDEVIRLQALRRFLADRSAQDGVEFLKGQLKNYKSNVEFLMSIDPKNAMWQ